MNSDTTFGGTPLSPLGKIVIFAVIAFSGLLLRVGFYCEGRPVWEDEAALAMNVMDKTVSQGFHSLDASRTDLSTNSTESPQACPIGYFILLKTAARIAGPGPGPLRLVALAASMLLLLLAAIWLARDFPFLVGVCAFAVLAFSGPLIEYSTEIKQYEWEAAVSAALLCFLRPGPLPWRKAWMWALLGALAVWCSFSSVFVLAGIGLALVCRQYLEPRETRWLRVAAIFAAWLFSFFSYYALSLHRHHADTTLMAFFQGEFAPFPRNYSALKWYIDAYFMPVEGMLGWEFRWVALGGLLAALGLIRLFFVNKVTLLVLVGPVLATMLACMAGRYPWGAHLLLFLAPNLAVLVAEGIVFLGGMLYARSLTCGLVFALIIGTGLLFSGLRPIRAAATYANYKFHDVPHLLDRVLSEMATGDTLYLYKPDVIQYRYYMKIRQLPPMPRFAYGTVEVQKSATEMDALAQEISRAAQGGTCWVILSHTDWDEWRLALLKQSLAANAGKVLQTEEFGGAHALKCSF